MSNCNKYTLRQRFSNIIINCITATIGNVEDDLYRVVVSLINIQQRNETDRKIKNKLWKKFLKVILAFEYVSNILIMETITLSTFSISNPIPIMSM